VPAITATDVGKKKLVMLSLKPSGMKTGSVELRMVPVIESALRFT
jgi:hypothetical protein